MSGFRRFTNDVAAASYYARKRNRLETAVVTDDFAPAWGTITFPLLPSNDDTIDINGTTITLVTGTPSGAQAKIVTDVPTTIANILTYIAANPIVGVNVSASGDGLLIQSAKPADTTITLAASAATVSSANLVVQTINARIPL